MYRLLAFIENDMYVRNFITSGAFDLLIMNPQFGICTSEIVRKLESAIPGEKRAGDYERNRTNIRYIYFLNKLSVRALRDKSTTFDIKVRKGWPFGRYNLITRILSHRMLFRFFFKKFLLRLLRKNTTLENIIKRHNPKLVIFPLTGVESTGAELITLSRKYGFKTLFLVNGWDNLSSKGVFPQLPDYLGLWGPQSQKDAIEIHGMPEQGLIQLGCARYEGYLKFEDSIGSPFPHKYILFAGATTPNDELTPLKIFDEAISESGRSDIKIVYRPHPWREKRNCFDVFEPQSYQHVVLDPQLADDYYNKKRMGTESSSSQNFPDLSYYPSLVNNAVFMISPMSSMTLEAALFDVPCLVLAHDDGCHLIPCSLQAQYTHFQGGDNVPGWFFVRRLNELKPMFKKLLIRFKDEIPSQRQFRPALSEAVGKYLYRDEWSYAERLDIAVKKILSTMDSN